MEFEVKVYLYICCLISGKNDIYVMPQILIFQHKLFPYLAKTVTDLNYTDDLMLLANTPAQTESLLHRLEQEVGGIGLRENANKMEVIWFKQEGAISNLSRKPLKFVDKFMYLSSNISSTERYVNWIAGNRTIFVC